MSEYVRDLLGVKDIIVPSFPEWFKSGCFEPLPKDSLPAAMVFYAKYIYASAYGVATKEIDLEGLHGLTLMGLLPATIEPKRR